MYNIIRSVQKTVNAYKKPLVSLTVDRRDFPPLVFAACLDYELYIKKFEGQGIKPMVLTLAYFSSLDEFMNVNGGAQVATFYARTDTFEPVSMMLSTRRFDCVKLTLPVQYRISTTSTAFIYSETQIAGSGGVNFLSFVQAEGSPFPPSDSTFANVQFRGASYQAAMSQRVIYGLSNKIVATDITMALEVQSINEPTNSSTYYLAANRCSFDATILTQSVAFDYLDCLSSIFAWASATGAVIRILFPMLPFGRRARFFCTSGPPDADGERSADGKLTEL